MNTQKTLSPENRNFFGLISRAIFANPFSDERDEVDALIAGVPSLAGTSEEEKLRLVVPKLEARLDELERQGGGGIGSFAGADRELMEKAWLFYFFHRHLHLFDTLIEAQVAEGNRPAPFPAAEEVIGDLTRRGFPKPEALRFLALFYQLRRAFYFVEKNLVGRSPSMKKLRLALWNNVFTHDIDLFDRFLWDRMEDFSTLLLGETGTGKGTAAGAIGRSGCIPFDGKKNTFAESFTRAFVAINLSQYPEGLIESELFGHCKGAFTGAIDNHEGVFSRASAHGALLLDEIGEVSVPIQIKLLQVLQERTFSPVGSHVKKRFEGRVIAATNQRLDRIRASGVFRDDFFYRLSSDVIVVPPLRLRVAEDPGELSDLVDLMVKRIVGEPSPALSEMVLTALDRDLPKGYTWPGNVRELEQAVRRILLAGAYTGDTAPGHSDDLADLKSGIESGAIDAKELLSRYCAILYKRHGSYEEVARRTKLDRRTAKKYVDQSIQYADD